MRLFLSAAVTAAIVCFWDECSALSGAGVALQEQACVADCDADEQVTLPELIRGVLTALGELSLSDCPAADSDGDLRVTIPELMQAILAALGGCQHFCGDGIVSGDEECDDPGFRRRFCGGCCFEDEDGNLICADVACNTACACVLPAECHRGF
jgi:hypothetical protein